MAGGEPLPVRSIIEKLDLEYHDEESGYLALRQESAYSMAVAGGEVPIHSSIYYLLTRKHPLGYLHWLESEDIHILVDGGPLEYFIFLDNGDVQHLRLGRDIGNDELPAVTVPARSYKALALADQAEFALLVNVLTPAWTADRVRVGAGSEFFGKYVDKADWASERFLKALLPED